MYYGWFRNSKKDLTLSENRGLKSNITNENKRNKKEYRERIIKKEKEKEIEEKKQMVGVKWINTVFKGSASIYDTPSLGTSSLRTSRFQYAPGVGVNWLNAKVPTIGVSWFDAEIWVHKKKKWTFQFTSAQVDRISQNTKFHRIHIQRWKHSDMLHQT